MPCAWPVTEDMKNPEHFPVALRQGVLRGRHRRGRRGRQRYEAADAVGAVDVDYEPLEAVVDLEDALSRPGRDPRRPRHQQVATTGSSTPTEDAVDAAFANAVHTVKERYIQQRLIPAAMEPRGVVVVPQPHGGEYTVWSATQIPHILKVMLAATAGVPEHKLRVIAPSVGGGFGSKLDVYAEELISARGRPQARRAGPVDRGPQRERPRHHPGPRPDPGHGAGRRRRRQGHRRAGHLLADMGAYLQLVTPGHPAARRVPLPRRLRRAGAYSFTCTSVFTNKTPTDAYRGAGRPEATYAIERAMDALAAEIGIGPDEIRRRNFIPTEPFPYSALAGSCSTAATTRRDREGPRPRPLRRAAGRPGRPPGGRATPAARPRHLHLRRDVRPGADAGAGVAQLRRRRLGGGPVRVLPTGTVQVVTGATPHGQGHETTWSMLVADKLGVSTDDVEVLHSDTAISPIGMDTYGSRSLAVGGTAIVMAADQVIDKARPIAAHQLEVAEDDLEFATARSGCRARRTRSSRSRRSPSRPSRPTTCPTAWSRTSRRGHLGPTELLVPLRHPHRVVEIDTETGGGPGRLHRRRRLRQPGEPAHRRGPGARRHRPGRRPGAVGGGGLRRRGQPQDPTLADYLVPSAAELPTFTLDHTTPPPTNPMGVKGIGEAGTIAAAPPS